MEKKGGEFHLRQLERNFTALMLQASTARVVGALRTLVFHPADSQPASRYSRHAERNEIARGDLYFPRGVQWKNVLAAAVFTR